MSETYTPGPLAVAGTSIVKPLNEWTSIRIGRAEGKNAEANAILWAAAPDLLNSLCETREAAMAMVRAIYNAGIVDEFMSAMEPGFDGFGVRASAAIAKAKGHA